MPRRLTCLVAAALVAGTAHAASPYRVYVSNEYDADISVIDPD